MRGNRRTKRRPTSSYGRRSYLATAKWDRVGVEGPQFGIYGPVFSILSQVLLFSLRAAFTLRSPEDEVFNRTQRRLPGDGLCGVGGVATTRLMLGRAIVNITNGRFRRGSARGVRVSGVFGWESFAVALAVVAFWRFVRGKRLLRGLSRHGTANRRGL